MKKFAIYMVIVFSSLLVVKSDRSEPEVKEMIKNGYKAEESMEALYQSVFITLLMPYITQAINEFYEPYLSLLPQEDPWFIHVLSVERIADGSGFDFLIVLKVQPYVGPHDAVGIDNITFRVNVTGEIALEKYEHIQSYPIAPNFQDIIKKPLPG